MIAGIFIGLLIGLAIGFIAGIIFVTPKPTTLKPPQYASGYVKRAEWRQLDIQPAMKRRQPMPRVIDVA